MKRDNLVLVVKPTLQQNDEAARCLNETRAACRNLGLNMAQQGPRNGQVTLQIEGPADQVKRLSDALIERYNLEVLNDEV